MEVQARFDSSKPESEESLQVSGAKFGFDDAAYRSSGRQQEVHSLRSDAEEVPEEVEAEKDGIVYVKCVLALDLIKC